MPRIEYISEKTLETFYSFFEWVYDVKFTESNLSKIYLALRSAWNSSDDSAATLVAKAVQSMDKLADESESGKSAAQKRARDRLRNMFKYSAVNSEGYVLDALYDAIEEEAPGVIGVLRKRRLLKPDPSIPVRRPVGREERSASRMASVPSTEHRPSRRSAGVISRAIANREPEAIATTSPEPYIPAVPTKQPLPPTPDTRHMKPIDSAIAMMKYFERLAQIHFTNGNQLEGERAMMSMEQYSSMAKSLSDMEHQILMIIWR